MTKKCYVIEEIIPKSDGTDVHRIVDIFDTKKDAEYVLRALKSVNLNFNPYRIQEKDIE